MPGLDEATKGEGSPGDGPKAGGGFFGIFGGEALLIEPEDEVLDDHDLPAEIHDDRAGNTVGTLFLQNFGIEAMFEGVGVAARRTALFRGSFTGLADSGRLERSTFIERPRSRTVFLIARISSKADCMAAHPWVAGNQAFSLLVKRSVRIL